MKVRCGIALFLAVGLFLYIVGVVYVSGKKGKGATEKKEKRKEIILSQSANGSNGQRWSCTLGDETVLRKVNYYTKGFLGPGYQQNWVFELVNPGEVTIFWQKYGGAGHKEGSYSSSTLSFDEKGNYTVVATDGTEEKYDSWRALDALKKRDADALLDCFCEDIRENRREETLREIERAFSLLGEDNVRYYDEREHGDFTQKREGARVYFWNETNVFRGYVDGTEKYTIAVYRIRTWEGGPEYEGVEKIRIWNAKGKEVIIGTRYCGLYPE